jgi:hypothetical protein
MVRPYFGGWHTGVGGMRRRQLGRFIPLNPQDGAELAIPDGFRLT